MKTLNQFLYIKEGEDYLSVNTRGIIEKLKTMYYLNEELTSLKGEESLIKYNLSNFKGLDTNGNETKITFTFTDIHRKSLKVVEQDLEYNLDNSSIPLFLLPSHLYEHDSYFSMNNTNNSYEELLKLYLKVFGNSFDFKMNKPMYLEFVDNQELVDIQNAVIHSNPNSLDLMSGHLPNDEYLENLVGKDYLPLPNLYTRTYSQSFLCTGNIAYPKYPLYSTSTSLNLIDDLFSGSFNSDLVSRKVEVSKLEEFYYNIYYKLEKMETRREVSGERFDLVIKAKELLYDELENLHICKVSLLEKQVLINIFVPLVLSTIAEYPTDVLTDK